MSHSEREHDRIGIVYTGTGQDFLFFLVYYGPGGDGTGFYPWKWNGTGVKIHSRVTS